jgi:transcriptional regulator with XRE-family HTH domain
MKNLILDRIRAQRVLRGLSQQNMADELNLTLAGYSKIERGDTELTLTRLRQIATVLNIRVSVLVREEEDSNEHLNFSEERGSYQTLPMELLRMSNDINALQRELAELQRKMNEFMHSRKANR